MSDFMEDSSIHFVRSYTLSFPATYFQSDKVFIKTVQFSGSLKYIDSIIQISNIKKFLLHNLTLSNTFMVRVKGFHEILT